MYLVSLPNERTMVCLALGDDRLLVLHTDYDAVLPEVGRDILWEWRNPRAWRRIA